MKKIRSIFGWIVAAALLVGTCQVAQAQRLRDASGNVTGSVRSDGTICDRSGNSVARIDNSGNIRDRSGNTVGRIDSNGSIRDKSGNSVGRASGVKREWAAVLFFFDFI